MAVEYSKKTNAELIEILKSRGLSHTGKKADMVARLQEADKAAAAAPAPAPPATAAEDVIDWDDDTAEAAPVATKEAPAAPSATTEQKPVTETPTTQNVNAAKSDGKGEGAAVAATATAAAGAGATGEQATNGTDKKAATEEKAAEKPAVDYSRGLATTDPDAELAKRKARAAKFGLTEEPAMTEAQKALARAKRFGTVDNEGAKVKGLDEALPTRKRGRGDDGESGRGKRRNFPGRGRGRGPRRGRSDGNRNGGSKDKFSEADRIAMEKRKERFAAK